MTKKERLNMGNSPIVNRINALLAEKGISKQEFYKSCNITSASYSLWNQGKTSPRRKNLEVIADYLDTNIDYLLTGLGEIKKAPAKNSERKATDEEIIHAFWGDIDPEKGRKRLNNLRRMAAVLDEEDD